MHYDALSELVILSENKGDEKLNARKYYDVIMDGELLDFWMRGMKEEGYVVVMADGMLYHKDAATERRKEYEQMDWID